MYDLPRQVYLLSIYVIAQQAPLAVVAFYLVSYGFCPKFFHLPFVAKSLPDSSRLLNSSVCKLLVVLILKV
jgi:hypothetical protein